MTNSWLESLRSHCQVIDKFIFVSFKYPCFVVDPLTGNIIGNFDAGIAPTPLNDQPGIGKQIFLDLFILHSVPIRES